MSRKLSSDPLTKGLPANEDAERFVLGSILLDDAKFSQVTGAVSVETFVTERHRRIWTRMSELAERGEKIDRVTLQNELSRFDELESVGGLSYLVSLDDGIPNLSNIDAWVQIIVEKYRLRKVCYAAQQTLAQALSGEYTADNVSLNGQAMLADTGGYDANQIESVRDYVTSYAGGINRMLDPSSEDPGISTGFVEFDDATGGFHKTEIFMVGARPSHGKTGLLSCIAKNVARGNKTVAVFSMELSKKMFLQRMICEEAYVNYFRFRKGDLNDDERRRVREATSTIMDMPLYLDDASGLRVADIRVRLNKILNSRPVDLMAIDYAQLIRPPKGLRYGNENDKFTAIGEELKILTKETKIPLLLLSQLNRDSEKDKGDAKPKLSQCRGAGIWEEISFVGACLYREWLRKREREDLREQAELIVEKNRSGPAVSLTLGFVPMMMRFRNYQAPASPPETGT